MIYKTIKAAKADGWPKPRHWEYGGEDQLDYDYSN